MRHPTDMLARKFAKQIVAKSEMGRFRQALSKAKPGCEHKDKEVVKCVQTHLKAFKKEERLEVLPQYDYERTTKDLRPRGRNYEVVGAWTFPDAAVVGPFRCAFEFDREPKREGSHFKTALMKAAVHVLSGSYQACVFFYVLRPGSKTPGYLDRTNEQTRKLLEVLE